jgi:hypothetical protein
MVKVRTYEDGGMSPNKKKQMRDTPEPAAHASGQQNLPLTEARPIYNTSACETIVEGDNNTFIILGRDRPGGSDTGYGNGTNSHSGCIDIIAGLSANLARETSPSNPKRVFTNKSTTLDAARIYISQRADIDKYFYCPLGGVGDSVGKSAIALKADAVRIIGREGIKIWAGGDKYSSRGPRASTAGIDLIGGTGELAQRVYLPSLTGEGLQPLVKGTNLVAILDDIIEIIQELVSWHREDALEYVMDRIVDATHVHPVATVPPSTAPSLNAVGILTKAYKTFTLLNQLKGVHERVTMENRFIELRTRFLNTNSKECILSSYNTTN